MVAKDCLFYDNRLSKRVPCTLIPNELYIKDKDFDKRYYLHVSFDDSKFTQYNLTRDELLKYSSELVLIEDLFPITNQTEIDYADACLPKMYPKITLCASNTGSTHKTDELNRYEALINMITDTGGPDIDIEVFLPLFEFINYQLHCWHCETNEQIFLESLSDTQLTSQPDPVLVPQVVRMIKKIYDSCAAGSVYDNYSIDNDRKFSFLYGALPKNVNMTNINYNVHYITGI